MTSFWQGKPVLVTGASGFIGSHLVERLACEGAQVHAFVRCNSRGDSGHLRLLPKLSPHLGGAGGGWFEIIAGDLRDPVAVLEAMQSYEIVFHLGALISIPYSYFHPTEVAESNVMGTLNVLNAGRQLGIKRLVHTSTSEVYSTACASPSMKGIPYKASRLTRPARSALTSWLKAITVRLTYR
jgi:nucleoside-diphosphate-sugar epimerase